MKNEFHLRIYRTFTWETNEASSWLPMQLVAHDELQYATHRIDNDQFEDLAWRPVPIIKADPPKYPF